MAHVNIANWTRADYERAAEEYLHSLPPEHFMEATPQATQREITVESLSLVHAARPEIQYFNELLVQYPLEGHARGASGLRAARRTHQRPGPRHRAWQRRCTDPRSLH